MFLPTGLWALEVSHNDLREIPSFAFSGLKFALWELHLNHNKLTQVPAEAIMVLKKLSVLNLAGKDRLRTLGALKLILICTKKTSKKLPLFCCHSNQGIAFFRHHVVKKKTIEMSTFYCIHFDAQKSL